MEAQTNHIVFIIVASVFMIALMAFGLIDLFLRYKNRQLNHRNELLELNQQFSQELLQVRQEVTEQVLKNISVELHDNICQTLTLAVVQLNNADPAFDTDSHELVKSSRANIRKALSELRNISHSLNGDYLKNFNLRETLLILFEQLKKTSQLTIKFEMTPVINFISKDQEIILTRILQELINNSVKHSNASSIELTVNETHSGVSITYSDDGIGFESKKTQYGMGLVSIKQRLDLLKAHWKLQSSPGAGIHFHSIIPTKESYASGKN